MSKKFPKKIGGFSPLEGRSGQHEADEDIRAGRVKRFDNTEDMIASLKRP